MSRCCRLDWSAFLISMFRMKVYNWCALQDLLNNLESCDLDDDDLMLDADVSEDASLHSGRNPSSSESSVLSL